jgi:hypothetical protein
MAFGHFGVGVGVVKVAVWCKHYMSEILVEWKPYFMAVRPISAYFQVYVLRAFVSSERVFAEALIVFLLVCVHENVVFWAGYPRSHSGCVVGVVLSGFGILNSCFLRLSFFDVVGFQRFSRCAISPRGVLRWTLGVVVHGR